MVSYRTPHRVLVVGLGGSGRAAARLAAADGSRVRVTDLRPEAELDGVLANLPEVEDGFFGGHPASALEDVDLVVTSPGVAADAEILVTARGRGIPVLPEVELAWRHRPEAPLVAVTGSNGKSTVTTLIAEILRAAGVAAAAGGNLGVPACELILEDGWDVWVLEISSFQSELLVELNPRVGVFLNLSQDHLERHPSLTAYRDAKLRLFARQGPEDALVLNADDPPVAGTETAARRLPFSLVSPAEGWLDGDLLRLGGEALMPAERVALAGRHNLANALAAAVAARELGATPAAARTVLERFPGLPHRHATVHESGGVRWVDDSKATNVGATVAALGGYPERSVHLILGGLGKGQDFAALAPAVARAACVVYLIGADAEVIASALLGAAPIEQCGTLEEAVERARRRVSAGETVLLAPACASFDQFAGYAERGERFAALAGKEAAPCR